MDLVAECKEKLAHFRVKELKDILTQIGLLKQGRKQDLVDRILAVLSDEQVSGSGTKKNDVRRDEVAKLVDDTYRKMNVSRAAYLASKSQDLSDRENGKLKEDNVDSYQMNKTRCLCGSPVPTDSMIKCEDPRCSVEQHISCVVIPEKPMEGVSPNPPEIYYCETCRLSRADPFWMTVVHPLYPVKLNIINVPADGSSPSLGIEKVFQLTKADMGLLSKPEYDVQAWCMLLNDNVPFRMQWPQYADLQVNGLSVRAMNRPGSQLLGTNGRDDGSIITKCTRDGINKISVTGCDARIFCVGVRIVKRRTLHQILSLIPKEAEGESFEDALTRVRKCIGGGATTENAVSDSDIEIVADFIPVNLRCPMSGLRLNVAGRFKLCAHMGCFDLEVFVEMNQRSRKWQCPICLKNYSWETMIIDPYFNRITSKMRNSGDDLAEIEVKPDGSWRVKAEFDRRRGLGDLVLWHLPDGTLCDTSEVESKPKSELQPAIQEVNGDSDDALKLGIKKNQNGSWEFNKHGDMKRILPGNRFHKNLNSYDPHIIPLSSSVTDSGRDAEDASVNQDGIEYESKSLIIDLLPGFYDPTTVPARDDVVIVLSDSEDETKPLVSSGAIYNNDAPAPSGIHYPAPQIVDPYYENPALVTGVHLYNPNDDDEFGSSMLSLPSVVQGVPSLPLFGSDANISDPLVDIHLGTVPAAQHSNENDVSGDNHLAISGEDPSLQMLLPTRLSGAATTQSGSVDHQDTLNNGMHTEDWVPLNLGNSGARNQGGSASVNASGSVLQSQDGSLDLLASHATISLGLNGSETRKTSRVRTDSPSTFPHQKRSALNNAHAGLVPKKQGTSNLWGRISETEMIMMVDSRVTMSSDGVYIVDSDNTVKYKSYKMDGGFKAIAVGCGSLSRVAKMHKFIKKALRGSEVNLLKIVEEGVKFFWSAHLKPGDYSASVNICGWVPAKKKFELYSIGDRFLDTEKGWKLITDKVYGRGSGSGPGVDALSELNCLSEDALQKVLLDICFTDFATGGILRGFHFRDGGHVSYWHVDLLSLLCSKVDTVPNYKSKVFQESNFFIFTREEDQRIASMTELDNLTKRLCQSTNSQGVVSCISKTDHLVIYLVQLNSPDQKRALMINLRGYRRESGLPEILEFQALTDRTESGLPEILEFQTLTGRTESGLPEILEFQTLPDRTCLFMMAEAEQSTLIHAKVARSLEILLKRVTESEAPSDDDSWTYGDSESEAR